MPSIALEFRAALSVKGAAQADYFFETPQAALKFYQEDFKMRIRASKVNRQYKDRVFCKLFGENKEYALSLYNAVNGTQYDDPEAIEYDKVDGAVYMGMKNDVSFYLEMELNLWEHQSTFDANLPLRGFAYFEKIYSRLVSGAPMRLYRAGFKIPTPRFIIFYNGNRDVPDEMTLRLTDLMEHPEKSDLQVTAHLVNINRGRSPKLMENCRTLSDYSTLVQRVKDNLDAGMDLDEAVADAIKRSIADGLLPGFLERQAAEVADMFITEYDEERVRQIWREDGIEEGRKKGLKEGREEGRKEGRKEGREEGRKEGRASLLKELIEAKVLTAEQAEEFAKKLDD